MKKFLKYAETIPYTLGNPLYTIHSAIFFNINKLLNAESARATLISATLYYPNPHSK
jgi:glucuronate isomerase